MLFQPLVGERFVDLALKTHTPSTFCETFESPEVRRLVERFEFHYLPKHGSLLNMAQIELSTRYDNVWIGICLTQMH